MQKYNTKNALRHKKYSYFGEIADCFYYVVYCVDENAIIKDDSQHGISISILSIPICSTYAISKKHFDFKNYFVILLKLRKKYSTKQIIFSLIHTF